MGDEVRALRLSSLWAVSLKRGSALKFKGSSELNGDHIVKHLFNVY